MAIDQNRSSTDESARGDAPRYPRAFAQGTGFVFQIVGFILMAGGCCLASLSGWIQGEQVRAPGSVVEWVRQSPPGQLIAAVNIVVTALAGLGLVVFGLGLHQERPGSGGGAVATTVVLTVSWWATTAAAILAAPSPTRIALNAALALGATLLLVMALAARRELQVHPPPPDEPVTEEFLKQFERRREPVEEDQPPD